jgi:hypothetical protein
MSGTSELEMLAYMEKLVELERAGESVMVRFGPYTIMVMIGAMQLATRHPDMSSPDRARLNQIVANFRSAFAGTMGAEIIDRGADPTMDAPMEKKLGTVAPNFYMRWQKDQPRKGPVITLPADHPVRNMDCWECRQEFEPGDRICMFALGPQDVAEAARHDAGHWYSVLCSVVHDRCGGPPVLSE